MRLDHLTGLGTAPTSTRPLAGRWSKHSREPHGLVLVLLDPTDSSRSMTPGAIPVGDLVLSRFAQLRRGAFADGSGVSPRRGRVCPAAATSGPEAWRPVWLRLQHVLHSQGSQRAFSVGGAWSRQLAVWHGCAAPLRDGRYPSLRPQERRELRAFARIGHPLPPGPLSLCDVNPHPGDGGRHPRHPSSGARNPSQTKARPPEPPVHRSRDGMRPAARRAPRTFAAALSRRLPTRPTGFSMTPGAT